MAESEEDWSSDDFTGSSSNEDAFLPRTELGVLRESIKETVTCLLLLSVHIRRAAKMDRYTRSDAQSSLDPRYDIDYVRQKFPHAAKKPWLVERLGKAITRRRQYFLYRRHHREKLARDAKAKALSERATTADRLDEPGNDQSAEPLDPTITSESLTEATPLSPLESARARSPSEDDDVTEPSYVSSSPSANAPSIPPPPASAVIGTPFECPYCFEIVQLKSVDSWRSVSLMSTLWQPVSKPIWPA